MVTVLYIFFIAIGEKILEMKKEGIKGLRINIMGRLVTPNKITLLSEIGGERVDDLMKRKLIKKVRERKKSLLNKGFLASLEYTEAKNEQLSFLNELLDILEGNQTQ